MNPAAAKGWSAGVSIFKNQGERYFAWLPSVPQGEVSGTITVAGKSEIVTGTGYHDHTWGDTSMAKLIHDWYWGRAKIGTYTVIASYITATDAYGRSTPRAGSREAPWRQSARRWQDPTNHSS